MSTALIVALLAIEVLLVVAVLAGWVYDHRFVPYVRIGALGVLLLLFVVGVLEWSARYYALGVWLVVLVGWAALSLSRGTKPDRPAGGVIAGASVAVVTLLAAAPALVFPEYTPLSPSGDFSVETRIHTITDPLRNDGYAEGSTPRSLTVGLWYPDVNAGSFPLVVFSHGSLGIRNSNETMFNELASHGYVVASIDHSGHALYSTDSSGHRTWIDSGYLGEIRRESARSDPEQSYRYYTKWMGVRIADIDLVIDHILAESANSTGDPAYRLVDRERLGLAGHSLGGAAVLGVGRHRRDIDAVIALESPYMADIQGVSEGRFIWNPDPYPVPVLNVYSDGSWEHLGEWPQYARNWDLLEDPSTFNVHIRNVGHLHLTDLALTSPLLTRILNGHPSTGDARETLEGLNQLALEFFDTYLKDQGSFRPPG